MIEREAAFENLRLSPMRHVLAGWVVAVAISFAALAASLC
jgi:hypothetical protein